MKRLVKKISQLALAAGLLLFAGTSTSLAQDSYENIDPVDVIEVKIDKLEFELEDLKTLSTANMTKAEKKAHKRKKRLLKRQLNHQYDLHTRLTRPRTFSPYTYGRYNYSYRGCAPNPYNSFRRAYYTPRLRYTRVVNTCPSGTYRNNRRPIKP